MVAKHADKQTLCEQLINTTIELAKNSNFSSAHWLFPTKEETKLFTKQELTTRLGCQYHWHNNGYQSFEDYLKHLNARKRKNILKERRQIEKAGIKFRVLSGNEITQDEWNIFHHYYKTIYDRKWGYPSLTQAFFEEIGNTLPENIVLVLAYKQDECIAMALNLRSDHTLYGRHWGCSEYIPALHFETCYYQGLEYCIKHGLKSFEPGAQGEHKIARGFLPTATWSAHWIGHKGFADAIDEFCQREKNEMEYVIEHLTQQSPFRKKTY